MELFVDLGAGGLVPRIYKEDKMDSAAGQILWLILAVALIVVLCAL